jgi:histone H3/H4
MIKDESGLSTSSQAIEQLTIRVQAICNKAIENAKADKRKTVMDRDFSAPTSLT